MVTVGYFFDEVVTVGLMLHKFIVTKEAISKAKLMRRLDYTSDLLHISEDADDYVLPEII